MKSGFHAYEDSSTRCRGSALVPRKFRPGSLLAFESGNRQPAGNLQVLSGDHTTPPE